ncbi:MAG: CaiB/BaiF CoA-transferase family protein [Armatimonadota bacterium]
MKPLENIVVLDMSRVLAGPYCTMLLREMGARVVKIEHPVKGDDSRHYGPFKNEKSVYFLSINREKESITVDLKKEEGIEIIKRFVKKADVLVENFRPGTMEKLGLGYETLKELNPKLIYASLSGFGHTGPWANKPAYDMIVQALGGMMSITGWPEGPPVRVGMSVGDIVVALFAAIGINAAIYQRTITGKGQKLDISMLDCQLAILENALIRYLVDGSSPAPLGTRHPTITPFQAFKTKDAWLIVAIGNDKIWETFCNALELIELKENPKFKTNKLRCENYIEISQILEELFSKKTASEWEEILHTHHIPSTRIAKMEEVAKNPQLKIRKMFVETEDPVIGRMTLAGNPVKMSSSEDSDKRGKAPELGEHTFSILEEFLEYDYNEIEKLKKDGVI